MIFLPIWTMVLVILWASFALWIELAQPRGGGDRDNEWCSLQLANLAVCFAAWVVGAAVYFVLTRGT